MITWSRGSAGLDIFDKCKRFDRAQSLMDSGLYPYFRPISNSEGTRVEIDGRQLLMVGSNNYLGLTHDPRVKEAAVQAIRTYGTSCTGSRFLNGTTDLHIELEKRLAEFLGYPACITFPTGFAANLGAITALASKGDVVFCDRENHASIVDACRLATADVRRYRHGNLEELEEKLSNTPDNVGKLVVVDGVYSMVGRIADIPAIATLAKKYGARFIVDDAHGVGPLGDGGRGTCSHFGRVGPESGVDLVIGTFSKSLASLGGFVVGSEEVIHFVKHIARSLMFSASVSPPNAAAALEALNIIDSEPERIERLRGNVRFMKTGLDAIGLDTMGSETPIIPIRVGSEERVFELTKELFERGIFVNPVVPPGSPVGLLRTSYMATHEQVDLAQALSTFTELAEGLTALSKD